MRRSYLLWLLVFCSVLSSSSARNGLQDCECKFMSKYVKVGSIKKEEVPVADGESAAEKNEGKCSYLV